MKLLLQSHTLKDVCKVTQSLLADEIFSSEKKAEARFTKAVVSLPETATTTVSSSAAAAAANKQSMILRERANTGKDGNEQCMLEAGENRAIRLQDDGGVADINCQNKSQQFRSVRRKAWQTRLHQRPFYHGPSSQKPC